jgi:hypothetical protein
VEIEDFAAVLALTMAPLQPTLDELIPELKQVIPDNAPFTNPIVTPGLWTRISCPKGSKIAYFSLPSAIKMTCVKEGPPVREGTRSDRP